MFLLVSSLFVIIPLMVTPRQGQAVKTNPGQQSDQVTTNTFTMCHNHKYVNIVISCIVHYNSL